MLHVKNMHATASSLFLFHRFRKFPAIVPAQFLALLVRLAQQCAQPPADTVYTAMPSRYSAQSFIPIRAYISPVARL